MIHSLFHFLAIVLEVLFLFNLLILVHELGHFLAARARGLVVERVGIWFGAPLWKGKVWGVEFTLGWIPAGGYVALPQMGPVEFLEGKQRVAEGSLPAVAPWDKMIVAAAGPLASLLLAFFFACIVWVVGRPVSESELTTVIGYVVKGSPAEKAGLRPGDRILEVDHHPVHRFQGMDDSAIAWRIVRSEGPTIHIKFERQGKILETEVTPERAERPFFQRQGLRQILILPAQTPVVAKVFRNSPAERAGIQPNDQILAVNGQRLLSPLALGDYIAEHGNEVLRLTIRRGEKVWDVQVRPEPPLGEEKPKLGVQWDLNGVTRLIHPDPWTQFRTSIAAMMSTISALLSPRSDIKPQHLSGPVGIMRFYYMLFENEQGWRLALWFSVLFNVNLAILNLLPIPVLDGGHIVIAAFEWLRGRPLSRGVLEAIQTACATLLIGYMLYVTFFDVQDLPWRRSREAPVMQFGPRTLEKERGR
jgi:regulator of sigma E protease